MSFGNKGHYWGLQLSWKSWNCYFFWESNLTIILTFNLVAFSFGHFEKRRKKEKRSAERREKSQAHYRCSNFRPPLAEKKYTLLIILWHVNGFTKCLILVQKLQVRTSDTSLVEAFGEPGTWNEVKERFFYFEWKQIMKGKDMWAFISIAYS